MKLPRPLANLALTLASLAIGTALIWAAGEGFFRLRYGDLSPGPPEAGWFRFHETRGWALVPGRYRFFHFGSFRPVEVEINAEGLRGPPLGSAPADGARRVTLLGDSFSFAEALDEADSFAGRLRARLGPEGEVVNVAVPGYGTGQQYLFLRELAERGFRPGGDLVLAVFTNDLQDNLGLDYSGLARDPARPAFAVDAQGRLSSEPPERPSAAGAEPALLEGSLFWRFLRFRAELLAASFPALLRPLAGLGLVPEFERFPGVIAGWYGPGWQQRWAHTSAILGGIAGDLAGRFPETRLTVAFIPSPMQVEGVFQDMVRRSRAADPRYAEFLAEIDRPQRLLAAFCAERGLGFVDTTEALRAAGVAFFPREGHLNEQGSEAVARLLHQALAEPSTAR